MACFQVFAWSSIFKKKNNKREETAKNAPNAGASRKYLRSKKFVAKRYLCRKSGSFRMGINLGVITKPEITKNISTPRYPKKLGFLKLWNKTITITEIPLKI
jgi:hypothetical protein